LNRDLFFQPVLLSGQLFLVFFSSSTFRIDSDQLVVDCDGALGRVGLGAAIDCGTGLLSAGFLTAVTATGFATTGLITIGLVIGGAAFATLATGIALFCGACFNTVGFAAVTGGLFALTTVFFLTGGAAFLLGAAFFLLDATAFVLDGAALDFDGFTLDFGFVLALVIARLQALRG